MTSNVSADLDKDTEIGFVNDIPTSSCENKLKEYFSPEFIDRIDSIIRFNSLKIEDFKAITKTKLDLVLERIKKYPIELDIDEGVIDCIAKEACKRKLGARSINKIISDKVEFPLAKLIIDGLDGEATIVKITVKDHDIKVSKNCPQLQA